MNKKETAEHLNLSTRLVEKHASEGRLGEVTYIRGKHGKQADYAEHMVHKLKEELDAPDHQLAAPQSPVARLFGANNPAALELMSQFSAMLGNQIAAAIERAMPRRLTLSRIELIERTGLPWTVLLRAIKAGNLRGSKISAGAKGTGGAWNFKCADVDDFIDKL